MTFVRSVLTLVTLFVAAEIWIVTFEVSNLVFPAPTAILVAGYESWDRVSEQLSITMLASLIGFTVAGSFAFTSAAAFILSDYLRATFYPLAIALKAMPLITVAPLILMWFGNGIESKIVLSALLAYFPTLVSIFDGMARVPTGYVDLMKVNGANKVQTFLKLQVFLCIPYLFSSLKVAVPLSVVGAVVGEYMGGANGIGYLINLESYYFNTELVFAAIITLSTASWILFASIQILEKCLSRTKMRWMINIVEQ